jgi:arabinogalactan endo-1,4-beta-galactosidase
MTAFRDAGVYPDMVQVGNEVIGGMMWPDGRLPANWDNFADLVKAGVEGVNAVQDNGKTSKIMIHIDRGGDMPKTKYFFDKFNSYEIPYDIIGQSYYPWWHGSLNDFRENMIFMASTYKKDIIVVEVAYNWVPGEYLKRPGPFPESAEGQKQFLEEVNRIVQSTPDNRGKGVFWWEPAVTGGLGRRGFFDKEGNALPVITVFDRFTRH